MKKIFENIYWWWKYNRIKDVYYHIRNRFFCKYYLVDTGLPRHEWCDVVVKMLYANMELLVDYIEKEKAFEVIEWNSDEYHQNAKKEMEEIYKWWKNYKNRQKEFDTALDVWYKATYKDSFVDIIKDLNKPRTEYSKDLFDKLNQMEEQLDKEEQEMLIRLIKIRKFLWT